MFVWLLWSIKESGYKYLQRNFPDLVFSPTKIIVQNITCPQCSKLPGQHFLVWDNTGNSNECYSGYAVYGENKFYFRSIITNDWLISVANKNQHFEDVFWGMKTIDHTEYSIQSKEAKILLSERLSPFLPGDFTIEKRGTPYPSVFKGEEDLNIPVSLSHDGEFIAYAFFSPSKSC